MIGNWKKTAVINSSLEEFKDVTPPSLPPSQPTHPPQKKKFEIVSNLPSLLPDHGDE